MMSARRPRVSRLAPAGVLALVMAVGCRDQGPGAELPGPGQLNVLSALIVSNPAGVAGAADALSASSGSAAAGIVYSSLPPGSVPDGERIVIRSRRTGAQVTVEMVEGGFDPIPVEATVGDTLDVRIDLAGDGVLEFVSVVPPRRPPIVVRTDPPPKKRDVPLNAMLFIVISEPIDAATLTPASVQLSQDGAPVAGTLAFGDEAHLTVTFTPAEPLVAGAEYTLLVTQAIADLDGDALEAPVMVEFATPSEPSSVRWESLAPMPDARWQVGAAALNGIVYVAGGVTDQGAGWVAPPEILTYDPGENAWRTVGTLILPVRAPAVAAVDNRIYVVGGFRDNPWEPVADLQIFDPATGTVVAGPPMPTPRGGLAVAVLNGRIHLIGGVTAEFDSVLGESDNTHEVFDPSAGAWSSRAPMPTRRGGHGAATVGGKIYVAGGLGDLLDVYDPVTDSWTSYDSPPARFDAAVVALGGKVYVFGGSEYQTACCRGPIPSTTAERFDPATGSWAQVVPMLTARSGHRAAAVGGAVYLVGGSSTGGAAAALSVSERFRPGQ